MTSWQQFAEEAPELARGVRDRFEAAKHHVLATLRADGSPRVSGTEVDFTDAGELQFGSMLAARKAVDLQRDGRCALHANPGDGSMTGGDAKVSGVATEVLDPAEKAPAEAGAEQPPVEFHLFRLDVREAVLTTVEDNQLVVQHWAPGHPVRRFARK